MTDKVCLITGGGRGMGAAVAREMHSRGYRLALMSPSESCEKLAAELGGIAHRGVSQSAEDEIPHVSKTRCRKVFTRHACEGRDGWAIAPSNDRRTIQG